ncbi:MAG: DNA polymerase III subunit delta [Francisellaceae bacterium]
MKVNYFDACRLLKTQSFAFHILSGSEAFQKQRLGQMISHQYKQAGYELITIDINNQQYHSLYEINQSMSLFTPHRLIRINFPKAPNKEGQQSISDLLTHVSDKDCYLFLFEELPQQQQKAKWFQQLTQNALHVSLWPLSTPETIKLIKQECTQFPHLRIDDEAMMLIAQKTEGNLLATIQIINLLANQPEIDFNSANILPYLHEQMNYDVFDLADALIRQNIKKALTIYSQIKSRTESAIILWSLLKEIRLLISLSQAEGNEATLRIFTANNIWKSRQQQYSRLYRKFTPSQLKTMHAHCLHIDAIIKGCHPDNLDIAFHELIMLFGKTG